MQTGEDRVQTLLDIAAIAALKASYCEALDALGDTPETAERITQICTEDCAIDLGRGSVVDRAALIAHLVNSAARADFRWHGLSTPHIVVQGHTATARWAVTARSKSKDSDDVSVSFGYYIDEARRTPEGWRLSAIRMKRYGAGAPSTAPGAKP